MTTVSQNIILNDENMFPASMKIHYQLQQSDGTYRVMGGESKSPRIEENERQIFLQESIESFHINQVLGEIKNTSNYSAINESYSPNNLK